MALSCSLRHLSRFYSRTLIQESPVFYIRRLLRARSSTATIVNLQAMSTRCTQYRQIHDEKHKVDSKIPTTEDSETMTQEKHGEKTEETNLTQVQKMKKVFAEYGSTAVVFHVFISLTSLGICYGAVKSGLDITSMLQKIGLSQQIADSTVTKGASTFVIAYACHKVFAPLRIFLTVTCTPLIVRRLRMMGILKVPSKPTS